MFTGGVVAVAGSRALPAGGAALVAEAARALVASGCSLAVGCCRGADAAVLSAVPASRVRVLCAFGPAGQGAGPGRRWPVPFASSGSAVAWWAGGGPSVRCSRGSRDTRVVSCRFVGARVVSFVAWPPGSWLAAEFAAARERRLLSCRSGSRLRCCLRSAPVVGARESSGVFGGAWCWVVGQGELF